MKLLLFLAGLIGVLLLVGLLLPARWRVSRAARIDAPPEVLYAIVGTLGTWPDWSPWNRHGDPKLVATFEGPSSGVGAVMRWSSASMGSGSLRLVQADPRTGVAFELAMSTSSFRVSGTLAFTPEGNTTRVTWTDSGDVGNNLGFRYFLLVLKPIIGGHLEKALAALKERAEHTAALPKSAQGSP